MESKTEPPSKLTFEAVDPNIAFGEVLKSLSEIQKTIFLGAIDNGASETDALEAAMKLGNPAESPPIDKDD